MGTVTLHVWTAPAQTSDADRFLDVLSDDERARAGRFRHDPSRASYIVAHALVRHALADLAGGNPSRFRFRSEPGGRPVLDGPEAPAVRFSLTHCSGFAACALTDRVEVGIDAEDGARQVGLDLIRRYFSHEEHQMLERLEPLERQRSFLELWTLKEAYLKARGLGVSERGLSNVGFQRTPTRRRLPSFGPGWQDDPSDWYCEAWNEGGIQLAASVRAGQLPVQVVQRTWSV